MSNFYQWHAGFAWPGKKRPLLLEYETLDIAGFLTSGKNTIAAIVWNDGDVRPEGQIATAPAFLLQADDKSNDIHNTSDSGNAHRKIPRANHGIIIRHIMLAGPGEYRDMHKSLQNWMGQIYDDSKWQNVSISVVGRHAERYRDISGWMMVPSTLPQMELKPQRFATVRQSEGILSTSFPAVKTALTYTSAYTGELPF